MSRALAAIAGAAALTVAAPVAPAQAIAGVPTNATIVEGRGAAGVDLGMSKAQVVATWGTPRSCSVSAGREVCRFASADGLANPMVVLAGSPRRVSQITVFYDTLGWTTTRGIRVGSTAAPGLGGTPAQAFDLAYAGLVDTARSTYYSRVVPGTDALGRPSITRFTLGWWLDYTPEQYFGVTAITVSRA